MAAPAQLKATDPHPEALARFMIENGDPDAALEVCEIWRGHDPSDPRIAQIEEEAQAAVPIAEGPIPLDVTDAERFVQAGFLHEALFIYRRLSAETWLEPDPEIRARVDLLCQILEFEPPDDASPKVYEAEEQIRQRRLPLALLAYHELAEENPADEMVHQRRGQLRALIMDMPSSVRAEEVAALGDTVNDTAAASPAQRARQQRRAIRTVPDEPPAGMDEDEPEDRSGSRRRQRARTEVDLSLVERFRRQGEAPTEREIRVPEEIRSPAPVTEEEESAAPEPAAPDEPRLEIVDEPRLEIADEPRREIADEPRLEIVDEPPPLEPPDKGESGAERAARPFSPEWMQEIEQKKRPSRSPARTVQSASPMVLPQDEEGRSVVEVPRHMPSVMERIPGRLSALDAAEIAEPLGVVVRPIQIIN